MRQQPQEYIFDDLYRLQQVFKRQHHTNTMFSQLFEKQINDHMIGLVRSFTTKQLVQRSDNDFFRYQVEDEHFTQEINKIVK